MTKESIHGFWTFNNNAAGFALAGCWQVYRGRYSAIPVFEMIDAVSGVR